MYEGVPSRHPYPSLFLPASAPWKTQKNKEKPAAQSLFLDSRRDETTAPLLSGECLWCPDGTGGTGADSVVEPVRFPSVPRSLGGK